MRGKHVKERRRKQEGEKRKQGGNFVSQDFLRIAKTSHRLNPLVLQATLDIFISKMTFLLTHIVLQNSFTNIIYINQNDVMEICWYSFSRSNTPEWWEHLKEAPQEMIEMSNATKNI